MPLTVWYASETGTAEDVAFKIVGRAEGLGQDVRVVSVEDYNIEELPEEQMIVFVCSTTGDGEIPSTMRPFWKFLLRKSLPRNSLENIHYGIFGLGDSGYDKFNAVARRLNSRLKQLGGTELLPLGLGDDQGAYGFLTALDPWMENLFAKVAPQIPAGSAIQVTGTTSPLYNILTLANTDSGSSQDHVHMYFENNPPVGYNTSTDAPLIANVTSNTRLTTSSWRQNVFHVSMSLPSLTYVDSNTPSHVAGDVLIVHPSNSSEMVNLAESYFSAEFPDPANTVIEIHYTHRKNARKNRLLSGQCSPSMSNKMRCTVRELFTNFLGLSAVPQRSYFEELSRLVPKLYFDEPLSKEEQSLIDENEEEREKLFELSSAEGADLYDSYCYKEQRGYIEILSEFRTLRNPRVPLNVFLELVPPLIPRHYSIASSGYRTPNEVHLCVAEVAFTTPLGRSRTGVASHFLSNCSAGDSIYCYIRKGTFPSVPIEAPLLMIGPGTGVAPMRALMHERIALSTASGIDVRKSLCLTMLLFGCRSQDDDFLYEREWLQCVEDCGGSGKVVYNCTTSEVEEVLPPFLPSDRRVEPASACEAVTVTAFSRKGRNAGRRVTHSLQTHQEAIWSLIQQENAHILVAGSASTKMPSDVRKSLAQVCEVSGGMTPQEAQQFLLRMEKSRRYCVEAWS